MNDDVVTDVQTAVEFYQALTVESDRGCALVAAAHLDDRLGTVLSRAMVNDQIAKRLLEDRGPLGTFAARIDTAYAMALIGPETAKDLHIVRRIRNSFAHEMSTKTFATPEIADRCGALRCVDGMDASRLGPLARGRFVGAAALLQSVLEVVLMSLRRPREGSDRPGTPITAYFPAFLYLRADQLRRLADGQLTDAEAAAEASALHERFFGRERETATYAVLIEVGDSVDTLSR